MTSIDRFNNKVDENGYLIDPPLVSRHVVYNENQQGYRFKYNWISPDKNPLALRTNHFYVNSKNPSLTEKELDKCFELKAKLSTAYREELHFKDATTDGTVTDEQVDKRNRTWRAVQEFFRATQREFPHLSFKGVVFPPKNGISIIGTVSNRGENTIDYQFTITKFEEAPFTANERTDCDALQKELLQVEDFDSCIAAFLEKHPLLTVEGILEPREPQNPSRVQ